jgi:hypothetical protein
MHPAVFVALISTEYVIAPLPEELAFCAIGSEYGDAVALKDVVGAHVTICGVTR